MNAKIFIIIIFIKSLSRSLYLCLQMPFICGISPFVTINQQFVGLCGLIFAYHINNIYICIRVGSENVS